MSNFIKFIKQVKLKIKQTQNISELNFLRIKFLGKKSFLTLQKLNLHKLPVEQRYIKSKIIYQMKRIINNLLKIRKKQLEFSILNNQLILEKIDISLPGRRKEKGNLHPLTITIKRIENFFTKLGFTITFGPEIEDSYHNFDSLNIPIHHPARTSHDTFWFDSKFLLRTQTSCVQIRTMEQTKPPFRIITSGRVYRHDYDQTHTPMFHQTEGFIVDKNINFANLKYILFDFLKYFFNKNISIRFRPSYFPFTVPSAEIDVMNNNGKFLEILGCGMIHPKVLNNVNIDSNIYSGFAFGIGIERCTMLKYNITDLRAFFDNDLCFLKQFQ